MGRLSVFSSAVKYISSLSPTSSLSQQGSLGNLGTLGWIKSLTQLSGSCQACESLMAGLWGRGTPFLLFRNVLFLVL